jgi:hypothetical protein
MSNKISVLVLEHNEVWYAGIENFYSDIIKSCGYNCSFIFIKQAAGEIIETKKNASVFDKNEIDLFITDLSLGKDEGPFIGLHIIKRVKEEFPELVVIANSSQPVSTQEISQHHPSFDLYVDKSKFLVDKYKIYITKLLNNLLNRNIFLNIDFDSSDFPSGFHIERPSQKNKLINLLKFVTYNSKEKDCSVTNVILRKIENGNSNSFVFQMDGYLENGLKCINSIIKISSKDKSRIEKENYNRFVKWNLPYTWRVELLSYSEWQDYGCICYSYAFDDASIKSATEYIKDGREDKLLQVLDTIFNPNNVTWYSQKNIGTHLSITNYYFGKWFEGRKSSHDSIITITSNKSIALTRQGIKISNYNIPSPESFLFAERGECMTCICHGDLNSNNILLSEKSKTPVFIDFQDTGKGHVFVDFIVFENCIRLYYNHNKTLEELVEFEIELNKIIEGKNMTSIFNGNFKMIDILLKLRIAAFATFPDESKWTYIYGLAMSSYARLRDLDKFDQWQINQLFASLFSSIHTLSTMKLDKASKSEKINTLRIFASYSTLNKEFVKKVVNDLVPKGILIWFDQLKAGENIIDSLENAINEADVFLVFIGETQGPWQSEEIPQIIRARIKDKQKIVIPCIVPNTLEPSMPSFLSHLSYIDFNINYPKKIEELEERLNQIEKLKRI